jgi:zinc D-Ala-D-Ala carboxypeptidase
MTQLTPHFSLAEMTRSTTALRKGIPNKPSVDEVRALTLLCQKVLEPVREHFGKPVIVTSGYRAPRVNMAVGGSGSSQHCNGEAVDFTVAGESNLAVCQWIHANLDYDQLIYEFGEPGWVHCSYSAHRMRNQELTARRKGGRTIYLPGIVA